MTIEWFPGHMATARREAGETMRRTDVVIEVLDARVPFSSASPLVEQLRTELGRPALKVLNKIDAADPHTTTLWLEHYNAMPNTKAIGVSAKKKTDLNKIVKACLQLAPERGTRIKPLRLMILGIPNVGKSTLMNALLERHVANVGDEPAITRHQSQHTLQPGVTIVDTPGMLWPGLDQQVALKLATSHSIGRNAYDDDTAAVFLAGFLLERYRALVAARFTGLADDVVDAEALLKHVAKRRGLVGNNADKAGLTLLNEFRSGKLGRITLETPKDTEGQRQQKATSAPVPTVPTTDASTTTTTTTSEVPKEKKAWSPAPATMKAEGKSLERKVATKMAKKAAKQAAKKVAAKKATPSARPASRRR